MTHQLEVTSEGGGHVGTCQCGGFLRFYRHRDDLHTAHARHIPRPQKED